MQEKATRMNDWFTNINKKDSPGSMPNYYVFACK